MKAVVIYFKGANVAPLKVKMSDSEAEELASLFKNEPSRSIPVYELGGVPYLAVSEIVCVSVVDLEAAEDE